MTEYIKQISYLRPNANPISNLPEFPLGLSAIRIVEFLTKIGDAMKNSAQNISQTLYNHSVSVVETKKSSPETFDILRQSVQHAELIISDTYGKRILMEEVHELAKLAQSIDPENTRAQTRAECEQQHQKQMEKFKSDALQNQIKVADQVRAECKRQYDSQLAEHQIQQSQLVARYERKMKDLKEQVTLSNAEVVRVLLDSNRAKVPKATHSLKPANKSGVTPNNNHHHNNMKKKLENPDDDTERTMDDYLREIHDQNKVIGK